MPDFSIFMESGSKNGMQFYLPKETSVQFVIKLLQHGEHIVTMTIEPYESEGHFVTFVTGGLSEDEVTQKYIVRLQST